MNLNQLFVLKEAQTRNPDLMSPGDYDRYQQDQMDYNKRDFKRREHEAEWEQEQAYSKQLAARDAGTWYVRINGKIVKDKQGNPYTFNGKAAANKAAVTMQAKPFNKGKQFMLTTNPADVQQGVAEDSQRVDSLVTDALKIMRGPTMDDAVAALKTVLGDREFNGRRGFYNFYIKQMLDMYGQQRMAEEKVRLDPKFQTGNKIGNPKMKGGVRVNNCVPAESVEEAANAAQQAAIAIAMKKANKKPKNANEATDLAESKISYNPKHRKF